MTDTTAKPQEGEQFTTTAQVHSALQYLLKAAIQRQIWLFFFDKQARLIDPIMPMNNHPEDPTEVHEVEDLGRVTFPKALIHRTREIAKMIGAATFVVVWERPGNEVLTQSDKCWSDAISQCAAICDPLDAQLKAMFLMHDEGINLIADYVSGPRLRAGV